jgi:general secretion pathway protein D
MIDWRGLPLDQVLLVYADLVNKTVLRAATIPEVKITLTTKTALTKAEARQAIDVSLGMNGIGIIPFGEKFVKAVPLDKSGAFGGEFNKGSYTNLPFMGQYITHVIQLKYVKPSELVQVLQPYGSGVANNILPIDPSQILVLRDLTENVKRMLELIAAVDVSVESEFEQAVIPIKYAKATEIANALNSLSTGGGGGVSVGGGTGTGTRTSTRTGSFGSGGTGIGGSRVGGGSYGQGGYGGGAYPGQTFPGMTTPQATPQATTAAGGANPTFGDRLRSLMRGVTGNGEIVVLGQTKMIADERTNSLLIYASKADLAIIRDIISKLDVVLAQVLIEGVIMEVNLNNGRDIGVSYLEKQSHGIGDYFTGRGAINNGNLLANLAGAATNGTPGGFSYIASLGNDLDVFIKASADASRAKILQRPRIQTSHNEPAVLFVGESRPYPTASYYGGGAYGGYSSIQQLQIGVTLEVTPLINPDGLVVMDIHQTIESANGSVNIVNVGDVPITSRKEASAKVSVKDRDTIILGGLIENSKTKSNSGVPFLKDLPLLGVAFRSSTDREVRNELIVLIRPTVLPTPDVAAQTARAEKAAMPLVREMEKGFRLDEAKRIHETDHSYRDP